MSRLVQKITTIISSDLDQQDKVYDGSEVLDDTSHPKTGTTYAQLAPASPYAFINLPMGITRIGFLQIETDAPILCRLNGAGEFPISPLITPALVAGFLRGPSMMIPSVQKGMLTLRAGGSADGNSVILTTVELRSPVYAASVKITVVGE